MKMNQLEQAIWVARSLFERGRVSGSAGNLSFRDGDQVFITGTGVCFGTLTPDDFAQIDLRGQPCSDRAPSKEYPLHLMLYQSLPEAGAVLHTHSLYATLWSCLSSQKEAQMPWPTYTPYLKMRLGTVGIIPYARPGSEALFEMARRALNGSRGYLLKNHGAIVASKDMMSAFCDMEELEESARTAWLLRETDAQTINL